jgi:hypothetical protein
VFLSLFSSLSTITLYKKGVSEVPHVLRAFKHTIISSSVTHPFKQFNRNRLFGRKLPIGNKFAIVLMTVQKKKTQKIQAFQLCPHTSPRAPARKTDNLTTIRADCL